MNTPIEPVAPQAQPMVRTSKPVNKGTRKTYLYLFLGWTLLIAAGVLGAKLYTDQLRQQIASEIAAQTEQQLQAVQEDYQKQIVQLKDSVSGDLTKMQGKIDSLNELLAFTKDSANSKTDNSNQLYTQLAEVKKKLDDLKKNLDVLQ
jgi:gas vesicle protein